MENLARFRELTGTAEGATLGATTGVRWTGEFTFDRQQKLITRLRLNQTEKRSVGAVSPGMEVSTDVVLERSLADEAADAKLLSNAAVAEVPVEPTADMQFLRFESWGLRFFHDRSWHQFHQTNDVAVFRLMEQGSLVAQVNISPIPAVAAGSHTPDDQFRADIKQSLGKKLKSITKAEQLPPRNASDRRFLFRVIVDGESDSVPMTWHYHLCASPTGQQVAFVFAVETKLLEKFGSGQELLAYVQSEAGKRFLESFAMEQRTPYGRILGAVQAGVILMLLGIALLFLRGRVAGADEGFIISGTIALSLGFGFALSAALSYFLSKSFGLLSDSAAHRS